MSARAGHAARHTLIYDGDCAFCRRCVGWLRRWDREGRLAFVPFQDQRALAALPPIGTDALAEAAHLVAPDGRVRVGAGAAPDLLRLLPGGRLPAALFRLPGAAWLAERAYRAVARHRHRLALGEPTACAVEPASPMPTATGSGLNARRGPG